MNLKRKTSNLVVKWSNQCIVHPHALCNSIPGLTRTKRTQLWFSRVFEVLKFVSCLWTGFRSRVQCHPVETICKDLASRFTERDTMGPKPGGYLQISANGPIVPKRFETTQQICMAFRTWQPVHTCGIMSSQAIHLKLFSQAQFSGRLRGIGKITLRHFWGASQPR